MNENHYDIAIIGAGASGLMLAANLDMEGSRGIVLEGSSCVGSKLLMSGGGHCNMLLKNLPSEYPALVTPLLVSCFHLSSNLSCEVFFLLLDAFAYLESDDLDQ